MTCATSASAENHGLQYEPSMPGPAVQQEQRRLFAHDRAIRDELRALDIEEQPRRR